MHGPAAQPFPFLDDGPDSLCQRYDRVGGSKDLALSRFGYSIRKTTLTPVFGIDVLLRHQPAQIENHLRSESLLQAQRNSGGDMGAGMDHLNPVALYQRGRFTNTRQHVV